MVKFLFQAINLILLCSFINVDASDKNDYKTIHVYVALCDNDNQGIIPVPDLLGNGNDPANNLYWGALYGVRTYFNDSHKWKLLETRNNVKNDTILQRCIFFHEDQKAYLIADAYKGDKIKQCITDFVNSAHGHKRDSINIVKSSDTLLLYCGGYSDLIAYVGHDGLMEFNIQYLNATDITHCRDAIILACASKLFFSDYIKNSSTYPLLWTSGLMAPEAYTLKAAIDGWLLGETNEEIKFRAAIAYNNYQKPNN